MYNPPTRTGNIHRYDYANWGYIILYLVVMVLSVIGNGLFLATIKKNLHFRRTHHFMLAVLAVRDLVVTITVIPFVIDSQAVNIMQWKSGNITCKLYAFLNYSMMSTHAFMLVFLLLFLYFWYRKQESYMTQDGNTVVRKTRMHKWAIPLAFVIGLGLAIPAGSMASDYHNGRTGTKTCDIWNGRDSHSNGYKIAVANVFVAFLLPTVIMVFPLVALLMQVCGSREPRLEQPHSRNAWTAIVLGVIFMICQSPFQVYQLMNLFHHSGMGKKFNPTWGTPYAMWTFETDIIINCLLYVGCAIHPIVYYALNPEYRSGLVTVWRNFACNQTPAQRREAEAKRLNKRQYPPSSNGGGPIIRPNSRTPVHMKAGHHEPLLASNQPVIMPAGPGGQHHFAYPQQPHPNQFGGGVMMGVPQGQTYLFPEHQLLQAEPLLNNSFERATPQLPPEFEYNGLRYIDTARVEPKVAYSPEKTPPAPLTPHFSHTPFIPPGMINPNPVWPQPGQAIEMAEMSSPQPPLATSEKKERPVSFELENLEGSPGNTLRERNRRQIEGLSPPTSPISDDERDDAETKVEMLQESPGSRRNRNRSNPDPPTGHKTNGTTGGVGSRPISPSSQHDNMEIVITGRARSRQDLCPDVAHGKFEHAV